MKIAVFSDTHGRIAGAERVIADESPDLVLHLGDHIRDAWRMQEHFPGLPFECVSGNCDYAPSEPDNRLLTLEGVTVWMTHGHNYRVKYEMEPLLNAAFFQSAQLVLFGHTHRPLNDWVQGLHVVNPGTAGAGGRCTWARVLLAQGAVQEASILPIP